MIPQERYDPQPGDIVLNFDHAFYFDEPNEEEVDAAAMSTDELLDAGADPEFVKVITHKDSL